MGTQVLTPDTTDPSVLIPTSDVDFEKTSSLTLQDDVASEVTVSKPSFVTEQRDNELKAQANAFVSKIKEDASGWQLGDMVANLGADAMKASSNRTALMDKKMSSVLEDVVEESPVNKSLVSIKSEMDKINPAVVAKEIVPKEIFGYKLPSKVLGLAVPVFTKLPGSTEVLTTIASRRETVGSTIQGLQNHLREHQARIEEDEADLKSIADELRTVQPILQEQIYLGELIWEGLLPVKNELSDPTAIETVSQLIQDMSMQVVDLKTIDNLNIQSRNGAEQLIRNSRLIKRNIQRVNTVLKSAVSNSLAVRAAAVQQEQTLRTMDSIQKSIGETLTDTSSKIKSNTRTLAQMSQKSVVDISYIEKSCKDYEDAFDEFVQIRNETEKIAIQTSKQLTTLNESLRKKTDSLTDSRSSSI